MSATPRWSYLDEAHQPPVPPEPIDARLAGGQSSAIFRQTGTIPDVARIRPDDRRSASSSHCGQVSFLPLLLRCIERQTYPRSELELVVADDGTESVQQVFEEGADRMGLRVRYHRFQHRRPLGWKRNFLNEQAQGEIIVCMDDDDYYPPERVEHAVEVLSASGAPIVGCSTLYLCFSDEPALRVLGPLGRRHGTNATFAYLREYTRDHRHVDTLARGVEPAFTGHWTAPLAQLDPLRTMICLVHGENTSPKPRGEPTDLTLEDVVDDGASLELIRRLVGVEC